MGQAPCRQRMSLKSNFHLNQGTMNRIIPSTLICLLSTFTIQAQNDVFTVFDLPAGYEIRDITVDENNNVWVATDHGAVRFDRASEAIAEHNDGLTNIDLQCIAATSSGVEAGIADGSLMNFSGNTWTSKAFATSEGFGYFSYIRESGSETYYGTDNGKVFIWTQSSSTPTYVDFANQFSIGEVSSIGKTQTGLYTYTSHDGIAIQSPSQGLMFKVDQSFGLSDNVVLSSGIVGSVGYHCTAQMITVADYSAGLPPSISYLSTSNSDLPSNRVQAFTHNDDGLWFGTDAGLAHRAGNDWTIFDTYNSNLPSNDVIDLTMDLDGKVWVATSDGRLSTTAEFEPETPQAVAELSGSTGDFLSVFPNPAADMVFVQVSDPGQPSHITIYNGSGQMVYDQRHSDANIQINTSQWASGLYLVKRTSDTAPTMERTWFLKP